jgi:hypothetical protein
MADKMDFSKLTADEVFAIARQSNVEVYTRALPIAKKIAERYAKKYDWISAEDLTQNLMYEIPSIMYAYRDDDASGNPWSKYLFYKLYFKGKDYLRKEDPVGIKWPQKKQYPKWHRLGDESLDGFEVVDYRGSEEDQAAEAELLTNIAAWRAWFAAHVRPVVAEQKRRTYWDAKRNRVKFKRGKQHSVIAWYDSRKLPKQLALEF